MKMVRCGCSLVGIGLLFVAAGCAGRSFIGGLDVRRMAVDRPTALVLPTSLCGHLFLAEVFVNERGPFSMIVDSGASMTTVTPKVARHCQACHRVDHLRMGEFVRKEIPVYVTDLQHIEETLGLPVDGILGHDVFRDVVVTYDYQNDRMLVGTAWLDHKDEDTIPTLKHSRSYIRAGTTRGENLNLLIDTGSARGISVRDMDDLRFQTALRPTGSRMRIEGLVLVNSARLHGDVRFGPVTVREPIVDGSTSSNLLGQQVLKHFVLSIDQRNHLVQFLPIRDRTIEVDSRRGFGAALTIQDGAYRVVTVYAGSAAEHAGLLKDDRIIAINGESVADAGCRMDEKSWRRAEMVDLQVLRGADVLDLRVPVEILVE